MLKNNLVTEIEKYLTKYKEYTVEDKLAWNQGGVCFKVILNKKEKTLFATSLEENQMYLEDYFVKVYNFCKNNDRTINCEDMYVKKYKKVTYIFVIMEKLTPMTNLVLEKEYTKANESENNKKLKMLNNIIESIDNVRIIEENFPDIKINIGNQQICINENGVAKVQIFDLIKNRVYDNDYISQFIHIVNRMSKILKVKIELGSNEINSPNLLDYCVNEKKKTEELEETYKNILKENLELSQTENPLIYTNLGYMYEKGRGTNIDYKEALKWYEKAAEYNSAYAYNNMAHMYQKGISVEKDYGKAIEYLQKAADLKDNVAQFNLALAYQKGQGVEKDYKKVIYWYKKAARNGNSIAKKAYRQLKEKQDGK